MLWLMESFIDSFSQVDVALARWSDDRKELITDDCTEPDQEVLITKFSHKFSFCFTQS